VDVVFAAGGDHPLEPVGGGHHAGQVPCGPGTRYRYRLDETTVAADPASRSQPEGVHGPSEVLDLAAHHWSDEGFHPVRLCDALLYELHVGTFTAGGTFEAAAEQLDDLVALGVTHVEVMPVAQFPGSRNWGYDGVFPYAVQDTYGGAAGLQRFVDECHRRGLAVVLDVVYNHLGPEGNVLPLFGPYLTDRYRTPWGPAVNLDGPGSDAVREFFVANALSWLDDFHVDALRLDAVHQLIDRGARPFLAELAESVRLLSEHSGRSLQLIAESADNDPRVVTPVTSGGFGMDAQWNDDFHHAVHAAVTAERHGYYVDFGRADDIARAMEQGFVYQGQYSRFRKRRHGAPSTHVDPASFVVYAQNHDQVGNRPDGRRLTTLVSAAQAELAAALVLLSPGVPLLFMGEEYGETNPFPYFVDHSDPVLVEAVRRGRAGEHEPGGAAAPDPAAPGTYAAAKLDRSTRDDAGHARRWELYRSLVSLRRAEPALRRSSRQDTRAYAQGPVVTLLRTVDAVTVVACFNLGPLAAEGRLPAAESWCEMLVPGTAPSPEDAVLLEPWCFRVFRSTCRLTAAAP
jgi:maltooligosyltrehalose trehalohydrolase